MMNKLMMMILRGLRYVTLNSVCTISHSGDIDCAASCVINDDDDDDNMSILATLNNMSPTFSRLLVRWILELAL